MSGTTRVPTSSVDVYADEVYSPRTGRDLVFVPRFLTTACPALRPDELMSAPFG